MARRTRSRHRSMSSSVLMPGMRPGTVAGILSNSFRSFSLLWLDPCTTRDLRL
jgi:hypothetical protein